MRRLLKFLHTCAACGMVGALLAYGLVLIHAPQDTAQAYADMRHTVSALCNYLLLPSMALALVTGLLSMAVHRPFMEQRWVWLKAVLGLSVFEATLGVVGSKAGTAAAVSAKIAAGAPAADELARAIAHEWMALGVILTLLLVNIVLGIWRPRLVVTWWSWV
jgi:hypothetical protein